MKTMYKELAGKNASINVHNMTIGLKTIDVRENRGIIEVLIIPLDGHGTTWINERLIKIYDENFCHIN